MAHEYTSWAWSQGIRGSGRKSVLVALADRANGDGYSYPGQKTLAEMTGQSERSVREHVEWLEEHGYVKRKERRRNDGTRTSDGYYLPPMDSTGNICRWPTTGNTRRLTQPEESADQDATLTAPTSGRIRRQSTGRIRQTNRQISPSSPAESAGHELPGELPETEPLTPLPPKGGSGAKAPRSRKGGKKRTKKQHEFNPHDPELGLPNNFNPTLFADFCDRLLEIGKPMTLLALRHFIEAHKHHPPETLDEMFRRSIRAGWPDIYPLDRNQTNTTNDPAAEAFDRILASARNGKMPDLDPRAKEALITIGGWKAVAYGDDRGLGLLRKRYIDAYRETTPT